MVESCVSSQLLTHLLSPEGQAMQNLPWEALHCLHPSPDHHCPCHNQHPSLGERSEGHKTHPLGMYWAAGLGTQSWAQPAQ